MSDLAKNFVVWIILAAALMFVFNSFSPEQNQNDIDYSTFLNEVQNDSENLKILKKNLGKI